jgi:hypothetical protein
MYILRAFALLIFLTRAVVAQQPAPILRDPKRMPGDTFDVTAEDVCVPGYAKKVRAVPAWLKRQTYAEYGITQYKTDDYEVDDLIIPVCRSDAGDIAARVEFLILGATQHWNPENKVCESRNASSRVPVWIAVAS